MILANKGVGPYIDVQYPANLFEELQLKISNIMSLFDQHRINKREPHYMEMKVKKKISMAIFYTGYSYERYVGRPNYEIVIFLSENDVISKDLEGRIRRIAYELLPQRDSPMFNNLFKDYYELLEKQELGPYWEESIMEPKIEQELESKKEIKEEESVESLLDKIKPVSESVQEIQNENFDFEKLFEKYEKPQVMNVIRQLQTLVNERNDKIKILTQQLNERKFIQPHPVHDSDALEKQLDEQNALLEEWRKKVEDLNEKDKILNDTVMKLTGKTGYQAKELESKSLEIEELTNQLKEKEKFDSDYKKFDKIKNDNKTLNQTVEILNKNITELKELNEKAKQENNLHLDTITSLKFEIKNLKEKQSLKVEGEEKISEQIIELKKELKVLRRERDTYLKKIKEKNIL